MRDAVDFVSAPDVATLAALELDALVYTGSARPSAEWIDAARAAGVTVTFIQETISTRSQQGYPAGVYDCQFAESRAKERGHAGSIAYVVSDGSWVDAWDASEYGRGVQSAATLPFFCYGAVPVCESFNRGAPSSLGTWVPETWGVGTLITQVVGPSPVPDTDLNHVHGDYTGIRVVPAPITQEEDSVLAILVLDGPDVGLWVKEGSSPAFHVQSVNALSPGRALTLSGGEWAGLKPGLTGAPSVGSVTVDVATIAAGVTAGIKAL